MASATDDIAQHHPDPYRDGSHCRVRCVCGFRTAKHPTYGQASAEFIAHLPEGAD